MAADPKEILKTWKPFKDALGVTSVRNARDYARARATMDALLDVIGDDKRHPLAEVLDYLADRIRVYEEEHVQTPDAGPAAVLRFLMEQHGLKQDDLADCAPQSRISDFLNGKRAISSASSALHPLVAASSAEPASVELVFSIAPPCLSHGDRDTNVRKVSQTRSGFKRARGRPRLSFA